MEQKKISVIIPVFNAEKYLDACVKSVLRQDYKNHEIVLVDDGSTDNSWQICCHWAKRYPHMIFAMHQENMGVCIARNRGIDAAKGYYLCFVDSDDELTENALSVMIEDAEKYGADIVSAVKCHVLEDGTVHNIYEDHSCTIYRGTQSLQLSLAGDRQTNSVCAKLFKREFIDDVRYVPGRKINEDGYFLFECYAKQPILVQHNVCIYKYFIRNQSATRGGFSEKYYDMLYFLNEKKKIIETRFPDLSDLMRQQEVTTHIFFLEALCRTKDKKYKEDELKSIAFVKKNYKNYNCRNKHERQMAKIIRLGLFPLYKLWVGKKYYR